VLVVRITRRQRIEILKLSLKRPILILDGSASLLSRNSRSIRSVLVVVDLLPDLVPDLHRRTSAGQQRRSRSISTNPPLHTLDAVMLQKSIVEWWFEFLTWDHSITSFRN
jgi:hypothetical protein